MEDPTFLDWLFAQEISVRVQLQVWETQISFGTTCDPPLTYFNSRNSPNSLLLVSKRSSNSYLYSISLQFSPWYSSSWIIFLWNCSWLYHWWCLCKNVTRPSSMSLINFSGGLGPILFKAWCSVSFVISYMLFLYGFNRSLNFFNLISTWSNLFIQPHSL